MPNNQLWLFSLGIRRPHKYTHKNAQEFLGVVDDFFVRVNSGRKKTKIHTYWFDECEAGLKHNKLYKAEYQVEHGERNKDKTLPKELTFVIRASQRRAI